MTADRHNEPSPNADPVTVILTREVRPGHEADFEALLVRQLDRVRSLEGHLGVNVFRPGVGDHRWRFIFKFADRASYRAWRRSSMRREWERTIAPHTVGRPKIRTVCGLETWFTIDGLGVVQPPPRWKMSIATWLAIYPTITLVLTAVGAHLEALPLAARTLILTGFLVPLMTFALMPAVTHALRGWLYPTTNEANPKETQS